jgi:hypothetical protein
MILTEKWNLMPLDLTEIYLVGVLRPVDCGVSFVNGIQEDSLMDCMVYNVNLHLSPLMTQLKIFLVMHPTIKKIGLDD